MPQEHNKTGVMVVLAVVGLVVGLGIGYMIGMNKGDSKSTSNKESSSVQMDAASDGVTVGGAKMVRDKDIVDNAVNAKNVTTVVDLVQKAGLVDTLKGTGPFTVFAPNNDAFEAVPKDVLNKVSGDMNLLKTVLTYHVVPGTYTSADLRAMAADGQTVKTVQGDMLSFKMKDGNVVIVDNTGQEVMIETADVISSNGVTHVIKNVLLPVDPSTL
jgi:uncharacterized surface protein with fasciclin (FAS1) repeats